MRTRLWRLIFNFFPAFRGTGARITHIAGDWGTVRVRVPLSWRTRNYVGTIFGGSMYGAVDPMYMIMLIKQLGPGYVVWDKAATIRFKQPGRTTLSAEFHLPPTEIGEIKTLLARVPKLDRVYTIELKDPNGTVCAVVEKTIHIRTALDRDAPK